MYKENRHDMKLAGSTNHDIVRHKEKQWYSRGSPPLILLSINEPWINGLALMDQLYPVVAAHGIAAVILAFVPPASTYTRTAGVIAIAALCLAAIGKTDLSSDAGQSWGEYAFGFVLHANCFLVLMKLAPPQMHKTRLQRLRWAAYTLFTPRREVLWPTSLRHKYGRSMFFLTRIASVLCSASMFLWLRSHSILPFSLTYDDLSPSKDSLLHLVIARQLTARDFSLRLETTVMALLMPSLLLCTVHSACAVIAVAFFESTTEDWPPLYGNISETYTLRNWYSRFWHQLMRKGFTLNAAALVDLLPGIRPHSRLRRSLILLLSFAISGIMHTVTGWRAGPCATWAPLWQYLATGIAIWLEQYLQTLYFSMRKRLPVRETMFEQLLTHTLGYCWVALWWLEIIPRGVFASTRCFFLFTYR